MTGEGERRTGHSVTRQAHREPLTIHLMVQYSRETFLYFTSTQIKMTNHVTE